MVRTLKTSKLGIQNPAGLAFSMNEELFHVMESPSKSQAPPCDSDVILITPRPAQIVRTRIPGPIDEPINMTFDNASDRLFVLLPHANVLMQVMADTNGRLKPETVTHFDARRFNLQDPQGMAIDPASGDLLILDSAASSIVRVARGRDGNFDGSSVSHVDLQQLRSSGLRGLAIDPTNGHIHVFDSTRQVLDEITPAGDMVAERDLSPFHFKEPRGMVFAPSGDQTDDPMQMSLYLADSGLGAGKSKKSGSPLGGIVELSLADAAAAPTGSFQSSVVHITDMAVPSFSPPSPDPSGLAYLPFSNTLLMSDGEVEETVSRITHFQGANVWEMTLSGGVVRTANISTVAPTVVPMTDEPTGVAYNPNNGHYYVSDDDDQRVYDLNPGADGIFGTADDRWVYFGTNAVGNGDPEGITYDSLLNHIFVADGVNREIYEYTTSGVLVNHFDVEVNGVVDPESVEFNPDSGTLYVLSNAANRIIIETTTTGTLLRTIDVSASNAVAPAGLAYAPASVGGTAKRFYIVDRGIDNNDDPYIIDGKLYEMTSPSITPGNTAPIVDAGPDQTVKRSQGAQLQGSASDDGIPNPPGKVTVAWAKASGPGTVTFSDATGTNPTASFSSIGIYTLRLIADDGELVGSDDVKINVTGENGETLTEVRVAASSDDAEENTSGSRVDLASTDLELILDGSSQQKVGMRFNGIDIAKGSTITNAWLQFKVDETNTETTVLTIQGQNSDQAATFASVANNISSRPRTTAAVSWSPNPWTTVGTIGPDQQTPDIASVIQEIVNRTGWASGNSLAIIIIGTGHRTAEAFDGDSAGAPLLHVEFISPSGNHAPVAVADTYTATEDTQLIEGAKGVLTNDTDQDGDTLAAVLNVGPTHGTLSLNSNGGFTYTPVANYNGTDSFTYHARDASLDSNVVTVTITVNAVNDAPLAQNAFYTTNEDTFLTVVAPGVLGNDTDADGDALTAVLNSGPTHGTLSLNSNGGFSYTPAANYSGSDTFTYHARDASLDSNVVTVTITVNAVNDAPVALNDTYSTSEGTALNIPAPGVLGNDTDVDGDALTAALNSGTAHGTLSLNANGSFSYTPNTNHSGTDSFTYHARDGSLNSNTATVTITISALNHAPVAADDAYSTNEDTPLNVAAPGVLSNDTDQDGDTLTAMLNSGPTRGTLSLNSNGGFTYTPAANYFGSDTFTYHARDASLDSNVATVSITVNPVNDAPVAANNTYSTDEDTPLTVAAPGVLGNDTDADGDTLTGVLNSGPAHGTLSLNSNGGLTYTPAADYNGPDSFTYHAKDGSLDSNVATVSITVNPVNDPPVAVNDAYSTSEGTALNFAAPGVLGNDTDADGDTLTAVLNSGPAHGTLSMNSNGGFTYTPAANYSGSDSFTYHARDGSRSSNIATVSITVSAVNHAPVAANDTYSTSEGTALNLAAPGVLGNDTDADGDTLTAILNSGPAHGTLSLSSNGGFTYTPAANYSGSDSFTYHARDGSLDSNVATVSITVNAVNHAPVAVNDTYSTGEGTPLNIDAPGVLGNDTDQDGDTLTAILNGGPAHGTLSLNSNGGFTYTPAAGYNGPDSFTYHARDGSLDSNVAAVSITVSAVNHAPVAVNDAYSTSEGTPLNIAAPGVLGNDTDQDSDTLTAILNSGPAHGSLSLNPNGGFTYAPAANYSGADSFTYHAGDGSLDSNVATVSIMVTAALLPQSLDIRVSTGSDDAEEFASGKMTLTSGDLEFVYDDETRAEQTVGMRFNGITIPRGSTILNAYIQFKVDEVDTESTFLIIQGENVDQALTFTNLTNDISFRPRTMAQVPWSPNPWTVVGAAGIDQQTPSIASLIQEIVNRAGWNSGNSLAIIVVGTGRRTAESRDGDYRGAPLLHVEYLPPAP